MPVFEKVKVRSFQICLEDYIFFIMINEVLVSKCK